MKVYTINHISEMSYIYIIQTYRHTHVCLTFHIKLAQRDTTGIPSKLAHHKHLEIKEIFNNYVEGFSY